MRRALLLLPLSWLAGCKGEGQFDELAYPEIVFSLDQIEFGEVAVGDTVSQIVYLENAGDLRMGVEFLDIGSDGWETNYDVSYDSKLISCPSGKLSKDEVATDTGDTGDTGASTTEDSAKEEILVLGPGCRIPVTVLFAPQEIGDLHGSLHVVTYEEDPESGQPGFFADPHNYKDVVLLHGTGLRGTGQIQIEPRNVNFGHTYPNGGELFTYVAVRNIGDGPLELGTPTLDPACAAEFSINTAYYDADLELQPGEDTLLEVWYRPVSDAGSQCSLFIPSNDLEDPNAEVTLLGNQGIDPNNQPPRVEILSPDASDGYYAHQSADPLKISLNVFDANQPANTLTCRVRSLQAGNSSIADCTPPGEGGYDVYIPTEDLAEGADALLIEVTDQGELQTWASVTVLWSGQAADSDDDGDGFGEDPDPEVDPAINTIDCDDTDKAIYPGAAELDDGKDNDCDGATDEYTTGGDDDGDSVSEIEGDCDDASTITYPGAPEWPDQMDNDCDGTIDEGTANYDTDGDGFTINDGDCNDHNADISPAAIEYCDGFDNDCDFDEDFSDDEGCIPVTFPPAIIGGCQLEARALVVGESTTATVFVYDPDSTELTFNWQEDLDINALGHTAIAPAPNVQTITWTAPPRLTDNKSKETFSVALVVSDGEATDYCYDEITVYADPDDLVDTSQVATTAGDGCGGNETNVSWLLVPALSLLGWNRRRNRREDA